MTNTLHAHVSTSTADCDGPISRSYVETFNDDERTEQVRAYFHGLMRGYDDAVNDFSEIHFMNRVFASKCGPYSVERSRITISDGEVEWHEDTEEGYSAGTIIWCREDCENEKSTYRDHRAESMGY